MPRLRGVGFTAERSGPAFFETMAAVLSGEIGFRGSKTLVLDPRWINIPRDIYIYICITFTAREILRFEIFNTLETVRLNFFSFFSFLSFSFHISSRKCLKCLFRVCLQATFIYFLLHIYSVLRGKNAFSPPVSHILKRRGDGELSLGKGERKNGRVDSKL